MKLLGKIIGIMLVVFGCFTCHESDDAILVPSGTWHYRSYNSKNEKIVEGWFDMESDSAAQITGEWHFKKIGNPQNIGPQVGDGILVGGSQTDTLWLNLQPQYKDNNLFLRGILKNGCYQGTWAWISFTGVTAQGTFKAEYED